MSQSRNLVPKIGLALMLTFFAYGWAVAGSSATGSPMEVFGLFGTLLMYSGILATLGTMFVAAIRAHRAGSRGWILASILFWPLSYVYTLGVNRGG